MRDKKYYLVLDDFEHRVVINGLNQFRTPQTILFSSFCTETYMLHRILRYSIQQSMTYSNKERIIVRDDAVTLVVDAVESMSR